MPVDNKLLLFLDFETYYADDYTLRDMTPAEYILDDRFESIMLAVKIEDTPGFIVDAPTIPYLLSKFPPEITATVTFNSLFDNAILAWRYGYVPSLMLDAMGMAKAVIGHKLAHGSSLAAVSKVLGLPDKGTAIAKVKGMRRADILAKPWLWDELKSYALRDNDNCYGVFKKLIPDFPWSERRLMDMVLRCTVEPEFRLDTEVLSDHLKQTRERKRDLLKAINLDYEGIMSGAVRNPLMSGAKFRTLLEERGVVIQMKRSPTGTGEVPAFAKTDQFMAELLEHDDPVVQALAEARLGFRSTIEESRCNKMLRIASLPWERYRHGNHTMPIPLAYGAAHTHRLGGTWGLNPQNFTRNAPGKPSQLRRALIAPDDTYVVTADLKQIEARLVAWVAGCLKLVQQFARGDDTYALFASTVFGFLVDPKKHPIHRFIGKTGILGLGYQCSAAKFFNMVITSARLMGIDLSGLNFTEDTAKDTVEKYRSDFAEIPAAWATLGAALYKVWGRGAPAIARETVTFGPVQIRWGEVVLPNGMSLNYAPLEHKDQNGNVFHAFHGLDDDQMCYRYGKEVRKIYGAKLFENIVQALARLIVMNAALRIYDRTGYRFKLQAHDELVYLLRQKDVDEVSQTIHTEMRRPPSWGKDIPLDVDISKPARSYGEAK